MSRSTPIAPITLPSESRRAEAFSDVGMSSPVALRGLSTASRVTPRSTTSLSAAVNSRVSSSLMKRDSDCSTTSSWRKPSSSETASFAWRIFPSRSTTNTGSGAFSMMMSAARALCGAAPSPSTSAVSVRLSSFLATVRPPFSSEKLGTRPFRFICLLETLRAIPRERERLGSRRDATSPSRCRRDVDPGGPGACAPDLGLRRQRLRLERPRLRTSRVRRQPVRRRRRPLVESALGRNRRDDRRRPRRARRHRRDHGRNLLMPNEEGLAELHTHLGGSVATEIMWTLAHEQGIALPVKDYWEFDELVTVSDARGVADLTALDQIYKWTELIQS